MDARAAVGEGPLWDSGARVLWWVDIARSELHRFDPDTNDDRAMRFPQPVTALGLRSSGGLVAAVRDGFALIDPDRNELNMIADVEADNPLTRMNDGGCDSTGSFWAGSMTLDMDRAPNAGSLYRLEPDHSVHTVLSGISISNGIDWSPRGGSMYFIDTQSFSVDVIHFEESIKREVLISFEHQVDPLVAPDGMCVDAEGCLWVAFWGGSCVRRFSPDGRLLAEARLPVTQVTSCAFGGADLDELYLTTASAGLSSDAARGQPLAGGLFRCHPGVQGQVPGTFRG